MYRNVGKSRGRATTCRHEGAVPRMARRIRRTKSARIQGGANTVSTSLQVPLFLAGRRLPTPMCNWLQPAQ
jgi:hypothetical protein